MLSKDFEHLHWILPNVSDLDKTRMDLISSELVNGFKNSVIGCLNKNGHLVNCELPNVEPKILTLPNEILEMKITSSKIKDDSGIKCFLETLENPEKLTSTEVSKWINLIIEKGYYDENGLSPYWWFALKENSEGHWLGIKVAIQFGDIVTLHLGTDDNGKNHFVNITGLERSKEGMLKPDEYFFITSSGKSKISLQYILNNIVSTPPFIL